MIDLNAIANSAVVSSQHQVNRTPAVQMQNNVVKMEQESKPAPSNVIQKLTIPQLIGYMQTADETSIRKLFKFLSKEQVSALQGINSQIEDEELREVIANYSAPDEAFDDIPDDTEVESSDTPTSDDIFDEDMDSSGDIDEFDEAVESSDDESEDFDEVAEFADEPDSDSDDLFDDEDGMPDEDEAFSDSDDNNSSASDEFDDIDDSYLAKEEQAPVQGITKFTPVDNPVPQGIIEPVEDDSDSSDMTDEFDDFSEDTFESDEDFDDIEADEVQTAESVPLVRESQSSVEQSSDEDFDDFDEISEEDTTDAFDDVIDDDNVVEEPVSSSKIDTPLLDRLVSPASQGTINSYDEKSVKDIDAFDDEVDSADSDDFDEFEDEAFDGEVAESQGSDDFDEFDDEADSGVTVNKPVKTATKTPKIAGSSAVVKPVIAPDPDIEAPDEDIEDPVIVKPAPRQGTKHLGSPRGTTIPSRRFTTQGQLKKSAIQSEYSSAFKGIRGLDDIEDITKDIELPVKRATKSIDAKPQAQLPCSDIATKSEGKAGSTLSRDPSIPEPTVGELYEKGWTLMTYMSKNRGNKAAMHLDVVGKYFPMAVIKAGEARGKFTIHKNYLRK